jgi:hypothetical protein
MNEILSKLRKGIQQGLKSPDSLIWKFDGQERGGEPFRVFLDLDYHGKSVTVEWRSFWGDHFGVSIIEENPIYGDGHDFEIIGVEATIAKVLELLKS